MYTQRDSPIELIHQWFYFFTCTCTCRFGVAIPLSYTNCDHRWGHEYNNQTFPPVPITDGDEDNEIQTTECPAYNTTAYENGPLSEASGVYDYIKD